MIDKIIFNDYKAFKGSHTLELKPITLLIGKNSSGKTSICKLFKTLSSLISKESQYKSSTDSQVTIETFNNHNTIGLKFDIFNTNRQELSLSFLMNNGDCFVQSVQYMNDMNGVFKAIDLTKEQKLTKANALQLEKLLEGHDYKSSDFDTSSCYIGPIRRSDTPIRYIQDTYTNVGTDGLNAFQLLIESYKTDSKLISNVSEWLKIHLEGQELILKELPETFGSYYSIQIRHNGVDVPISNVGQGITQVLPIIVQSYISGSEPFVIIEEPELHLHPAAHAPVAERLALSAKENGRTYIIESHSENFLLGLRRMIVNPKSPINHDDVIIYFINTNDEGSYLDKISIDKNGDLSSWPTGVFSESFDLMTDIMAYKG